VAGVGALLDEDAVVAADLLGDVAQQREVDGADAALRRQQRVSSACEGLNERHGSVQQADLAAILQLLRNIFWLCNVAFTSLGSLARQHAPRAEGISPPALRIKANWSCFTGRGAFMLTKQY